MKENIAAIIQFWDEKISATVIDDSEDLMIQAFEDIPVLIAEIKRLEGE